MKINIEKYDWGNIIKNHCDPKPEQLTDEQAAELSREIDKRSLIEHVREIANVNEEESSITMTEKSFKFCGSKTVFIQMLMIHHFYTLNVI